MNTGTEERASIFPRIPPASQKHENKKPLPDRSPEGTKWGVGARHALFPVAIIWHQPKLVDCSPTLFSVTCGVVGLIAGPFKVLRHMNFRVRFICPLSQWLRPLTCGPGWDTPVLHSHPSPLAAGRPSLVTMRWPVPRVSPLIPQVAILHTLQRCGFCRIATVSDSFHGHRLRRVAIPTGTPAFVLLSEDFVRLTVSSQFMASAVLMSQ